MKKSKQPNNLNDASKEQEFLEQSELAITEAEEKEDDFVSANQKPILTEPELKIRKARRTKVAVAAFVLLLGVGVMGNWYYENSDLSAAVKPVISSNNTKTLGEAEFVDGTTQVTESEYFSSARLERQNARDKSIEELQEIINNPENTDDAKSKASEELSKISNYIAIENKIETLVAAKGANNVLAVVSADGSRVDIIVDVSELGDNVILQIKEIAMQQLGCSFENVSIIQSNS